MTTSWAQRLAASIVGVVLATGPAMAFDPRSADILRLRLGMGETAVLASLAQQGIAASALQPQKRVCSGDPEPRCQTTLVARTRDGTLTIALADPLPEMAPNEPWVSSILYRFDGRGAGEPEMIRASVLDRFGVPTSWKPLAWCEHAGPDDRCAPDQPRLTFEPGPGTTCLLLLTTGGDGR